MLYDDFTLSLLLSWFSWTDSSTHTNLRDRLKKTFEVLQIAKLRKLPTRIREKKVMCHVHRFQKFNQRTVRGEKRKSKYNVKKEEKLSVKCPHVKALSPGRRAWWGVENYERHYSVIVCFWSTMKVRMWIGCEVRWEKSNKDDGW